MLLCPLAPLAPELVGSASRSHTRQAQTEELSTRILCSSGQQATGNNRKVLPCVLLSATVIPLARTRASHVQMTTTQVDATVAAPFLALRSSSPTLIHARVGVDPHTKN